MTGFGRDRYDDLVVGAGTAGLTAAVLLARMGRSVLLVEKGPAPGGALRRFRRGGIHFDTGFHFSGSIRRGELFDQLLRQLGVRDELSLVPYDESCSHRCVFSKQGVDLVVPSGIEQTHAQWESLFPRDKDAIAWYFKTLDSIVERTMGMRVGKPLTASGMIDEDFISLRSVLDERFRDPLLKGMICAFSMCYGSPPSQVPFAAHARVVYGLHQSIGRIDGGGDALAVALTQASLRNGVDIVCGCELEALEKTEDGRPEQAFFSGGRTVRFERCLLTIDPAHILRVMTPLHPTPAFRERVQSFEPSVGFLVAYGEAARERPESGFGRTLLSDFPDLDFDAMMDPKSERKERPLVVIEVPGDPGTGSPPSVSLLELSFGRDVEAWSGTTVGRRPPDYGRYKQERLEAMKRRLAALVGYTDRIRWLDCASMLTFRDYLNSSSGSAYGIRQKVGQYGLFGRLPGRNLFASGQSALLPGVMGAMMSSLFVVRQMMGKDKFDRQIIEKVR